MHITVDHMHVPDSQLLPHTPPRDKYGGNTYVQIMHFYVTSSIQSTNIPQTYVLFIKLLMIL